MAEYIEREALLGADGLFAKRGCCGQCRSCNLWSEQGCRVILEAPAADVVEVVRCKDCAEWKELTIDGYPAGVGDCKCNLMTTDAHFYCASGERRDDCGHFV